MTQYSNEDLGTVVSKRLRTPVAGMRAASDVP